MYRYLKNFTNKVYLTYHQRDKGHGVQHQTRKIRKDTKLFIICDSSSGEVAACKKIQDKGIDIVILDHHPFAVPNPHAIIVNPQQEGCSYPNKELSGVGVVWKTIQVLDDMFSTEYANQYLDLVACGLVSDVMNVAEPENRYIISQGMRNITNPGLKAILKNSKKDSGRITSQTIGFVIAPQINGIARLNEIELAIALLIEDNQSKCNKIAKEIKSKNEEKKHIEEQLVNNIKSQVDENDKIIIVISEGDKSFNGLVAMKLAEKYQRPVLVLNDKKGYLGGSYRGVGNFSVKDFLREIEYFDFVEGHLRAGGCSVKKKLLPKVKEEINKKLANVEFSNTVEYDLELSAEEVTNDLIKQVEMLNYISGKGFPATKFLVKNLMVINKQILGDRKDTVKIECDHLVLLKFRAEYGWAKDVGTFDELEVVGNLNLNEWRNYRGGLTVTPQVFIEDLKVVS